jgi:DUF177 domain-containing protein
VAGDHSQPERVLMPSSSSPLRIPVADLLRRPGASRELQVEARLPDLRTTGAQLSADRPVEVDGTLERIPEGIVVRGTVRAHWEAVCSRCLTPVEGDATVHVDELFEPHPLEGETYGLDDDTIDLEPMVRDALTFELPAAPLCDPDCAGLCPTCGADRNTTTCECRTEDVDPRWAALRSLDL